MPKYEHPTDVPPNMNLFWTAEDGWGAIHPDFPGISAFGETPEEAIREFRLLWGLVKDEIGDKDGRTIGQLASRDS